MRSLLHVELLTPVVVALTASGPLAAQSLDDVFGTAITAEWSTPEARQYDFWLGEWEGRWRFRASGEFFHSDVSMRLKHWLFPVLDGKAIIELSLSETTDPANRVAGFSIRYFDPSKERWVMAQDWPGWTGRGFVDQLQGFAREGRVQVFSSYLDQNGNTRTRRYTFSDVRDGYFRWDDASTGNGGASWASGSIVEFHRTHPVARLGSGAEPLPNVPAERFCPDPGFARLDGYEGSWTGQDGNGNVAELVFTRFNAGCALMGMLTFPGTDAPGTLLGWTYVPDQSVWMQIMLDGRPDSPHRLAMGTAADDATLVFQQNDALVIRDELTVLGVNELRPADPAAQAEWHLDGDKLTVSWQRRANDAWETAGRLLFSRKR